jgi:hypothetical protein
MSLRPRHAVMEHAGAGALAGVAASVAYAIEQEIDLRLFQHNADDLVLLGRLVVSEQDHGTVRLVGLGVHLLNGAVAGAVYGALVRDRLRGSGWLRGTVFATAENVALYPLALMENMHPAIRSGELASYRTMAAFLQSVVRHVTFGVVLGALDDVMRKRKAPT